MFDLLFDPVRGLFDGNVVLMGFLGSAFALVSIGLIAAHIHRKGADVERRVLADAPHSVRPPTFMDSMRKLGARALASQPVQLQPRQIDNDERVLRSKLISAGFLAPRAVAIFFASRVVGAVLGAAAAFVVVMSISDASFTFNSAIVLLSVTVGYMAPSVLLERKLAACQDEHRRGFPDFMDLMIVCSQAGLSMEAGMQRIATEMRLSHPSMTLHVDLALLEIRGGRPMSKAVESLAKRLSIAEARSFATLLHQTEELGSSLTQSLRAYSDDMRNKRMMLAEEKAYALPAKMVLPLTLFVFPVLMVALMLPVVISVSRSGF